MGPHASCQVDKGASGNVNPEDVDGNVVGDVDKQNAQADEEAVGDELDGGT